MSKEIVDESDQLLTSSINFTCPDTGAAVGASFTACGTYSATLKCPYRVRCRVYYLSAQGEPVMLEQTFKPRENSNTWSRKITLEPLPWQWEVVLISVRLYHKNGTALSPLETTWVVYDSGTNTDVCSGQCP